MSHVSDFTQEPKKILLDLVNESNNATLTNDVVDFALHEDQSAVEKNTRILVTPKEGSGYSGSVTLEYNRLNIQDFVDLYYPEGFIIPLGDTETFLDLIPEIEAGLAIKLTLDLDFEDQIIEPWEGIPNETKNIIVPILPSSFIYTGELEFILDGNDIPLSSIITEVILSGLNLPVVDPIDPVEPEPEPEPESLWWTVDAGFRQILTFEELLQEMHYGFSDAVIPNYGSIIDTKPGQTVVLREAVAIRNFQTNEWSARVAVDGELENLPTSLEVYDVDEEAVVFTADFDDVNNAGGVYFYFFTNLTAEQSLDGNFRFRLIF